MGKEIAGEEYVFPSFVPKGVFVRVFKFGTAYLRELPGEFQFRADRGGAKEDVKVRRLCERELRNPMGKDIFKLRTRAD